MSPIEHIQNALKDIDKEVEAILLDMKLALDEKDDLMLPIVQQKRVLTQALEDLEYLRDNPPTPKGGCGMSRYRED